MRIMLSLGSLLDTDIQRTVDKFFSYGILTHDNQARLIDALSPIIEAYNHDGDSAKFQKDMKAAITSFGIDLSALDVRNPNWLQDCWDAMVVIKEERPEQLNALLNKKSKRLYLYTHTNPWHFAIIGKERLKALGIDESRIAISYETSDPFKKTFETCVRECSTFESLIYLEDARPYPTKYIPDKIRHEEQIKLLEKSDFIICPWPQDYTGKLGKLIKTIAWPLIAIKDLLELVSYAASGMG